MPSLSLSLLGPVRASVGDQPLQYFKSIRNQALLIYLATESALGTPIHQRESLMELFWPGFTLETARHNLRQATYELRQLIPPTTVSREAGSIELILSDRRTVGLNPDYPLMLDVTQFLHGLNGRQDHWPEAVELYRGDFLNDFFLPDANAFEEWASARRAAFQRMMLDALSSLARVKIEQGAYELAERYARRLLEIDPFRENGYRHLMTALALSGRRGEALSLYEAYSRLFQSELGIEPSGETQDLLAAIVSGEVEAVGSSFKHLRGYQLKEVIGSGGVGTVYRAVQPPVGREVAIKIVLPRFANDPDFIRRFEAEAHYVAQLESPFIVPLYDYWREPDNAYLVMRWMRGGNLAERLTGDPWPTDSALQVVDRIASALNVAHQHGIVHRNLKPANILFDEVGNTYLSDFTVGLELSDLENNGRRRGESGESPQLSPDDERYQTAGPAADLLSLSLIAHGLLSGGYPSPESMPADHEVDRVSAMPSIHERRPEIPPAVDEFFKKAFAADPASRFPNALTLAAAFREAVSTSKVESHAERVTGQLFPETANPYKGLRAFGEADAAVFFGRETLTGTLLDRIAAARTEGSARLVTLAGPSGSGKSSVVKAGLIPALRSGAIPGSERWYVVDILPGSHPYEELEIALLRIAVNPPPSLLDQLQEGERGLLRAARRILPDHESQLLLLIDQFEELFTLVGDSALRTQFLDSLLVAATDPRCPVTIIFTLRADFYDRPLHFAAFGEAMRRQTEWVVPMTPEELGRAITGPANKVGLSVEPELVAAMVADVHDQPGGLPLLQFALAELYERRAGGKLTVDAYQEMGGVLGALGNRAEEIYTNLDETGREAARKLFLRLVTLGEGVEDTRRRVRRSELVALNDTPVSPEATSVQPTGSPAATVIEAFGKSRLLTFDRDPLTREQTVEVAHEALIGQWARLAGWLAEDREGLRLHRQLTEAAQEWRRLAGDEGALYRGARLTQAAEWVQDHAGELNPLELDFLVTSQDLARRREAEREAQRQRELEAARSLAESEKKRADVEQRRAEEQARASERLRRGRRALIGALGVALVLAIAAVFFGLQFRASAIDAERGGRLALARQVAAQSEAAAGIDPELSLLLAIESTNMTLSEEGFTTLEAERALFQALTQTARGVLRGHTEGVRWARYSPDGKKIVTASFDGTARLWDAEGRLLNTLEGHSAAVVSATFSPDGTRILTASNDYTARLWDSDGEFIALLEGHENQIAFAVFSPDGTRILSASGTSGRREENVLLSNADGVFITELEGHIAPVLSGSFSPDGERILTASADGTARLWDREGNPIVTLIGHRGSIEQAVFSPDGTHILTGGQDRTARLWDTDGEALATLDEHIGSVVSVAFSPDGERILTASTDSTVRLWDSDGEFIKILPGQTAGVFQAIFSPDGNRILTASLDGTARVWDAEGNLIYTLQGHTLRLYDAQFSPDGRRILTASADGTARLWDLYGPLIATLSGHRTVRRVVYHPDGQLILTTGNTTARLWDTSGKLLRTLGHPAVVNLADFSPDGRFIVTASDDETAQLWDADGVIIKVLRGHDGPVRWATINPQGDRIVTTGLDGSVRVWRADGEFLSSLEGHTGPVELAVFSPDGRRLVTASLHGPPRLWDATAGLDDGGVSAFLAELTGHFPRAESVVFSPDSRRIVTGGWEGTAILWDADGNLITTLEGHTGAVLLAAFNPDATRIVTASLDGTARLWDANGEFTQILAGHTGAVIWAGFSPDGRRLLTAGQDTTIRLWDASGNLLGVLEGHASPVVWADFSPDGTQFVTAGVDGSVRIWELWPGIEAMLREAEKRVSRPLTNAECRQYSLADTCPSTSSAPVLEPGT